MTTFALQPVQQALYSKLTGDGVLMGMTSGIYDAPPQHAAVPYVVIGDGTATLKPQVTNDVTECDLDVNVWTTASGRKVALAILQRLHGLLHQGTLSVSGFTLLSMWSQIMTASSVGCRLPCWCARFKDGCAPAG